MRSAHSEPRRSSRESSSCPSVCAHAPASVPARSWPRAPVDGARVIGEAVAVAEQLARAGAGGEIRLSESTWQVVRHAAHASRLADGGFRLEGVDPDAPAIGRRLRPAARRAGAGGRAPARHVRARRGGARAGTADRHRRARHRQVPPRRRAERARWRTRHSADGPLSRATARASRCGRCARPCCRRRAIDRPTSSRTRSGSRRSRSAVSPPGSGSRTASRARTPTGPSCSSSARSPGASRS